MSASLATDFYLNQHQFADMKLGARQQSAEATRAVATQFESLFLQQMLASMRSAATINELNHSATLDFYQEMYDKQLALNVSKQGGLGIAKVLLQQLPNAQQTDSQQTDSQQTDTEQTDTKHRSFDISQDATSGNRGQLLPIESAAPLTHLTLGQLMPASPTLPMPALYETEAYQAQNPAVKVIPLRTDDGASAAVDASSLNTVESASWDQPVNFVGDIWPHAQKAANIIGISTEALVAQSALETGWGKHMMRHPDGKPGFNLFGIKADSRWQGDSLTKPTIEFKQGVMQKELAQFRAYDSIPEALDDYVRFIQSSNRYQNAIDHQGSDSDYLQALQQGGYATDPQYANKIIKIMQGKTLGDSLNSLEINPKLDLNSENSYA